MDGLAQELGISVTVRKVNHEDALWDQGRAEQQIHVVKPAFSPRQGVGKGHRNDARQAFHGLL
jgi:hypothetical protein